MTGKELVETLEKAGYFEYTDKGNLASAKDSIIKHFDSRKEFMTGFNSEPPYQSYDLRFYDCGDCEELHEEGGVTSLIEDMQPLLEKISVELKYSDDNYDNHDHTITVNGNSYLMAYASPRNWSETFVNFAEMLNTELQIKNSKERLYLMLNDDSSYMIFLTDEQYEIIAENIPFDKTPLTPDEWDTETVDESNDASNHLKMHMPDLINSMSSVENRHTTTPSKKTTPSSRSLRSWFWWLKR